MHFEPKKSVLSSERFKLIEELYLVISFVGLPSACVLCVVHMLDSSYKTAEFEK